MPAVARGRGSAASNIEVYLMDHPSRERQLRRPGARGASGHSAA